MQEKSILRFLAVPLGHKLLAVGVSCDRQRFVYLVAA